MRGPVDSAFKLPTMHKDAQWPAMLMQTYKSAVPGRPLLGPRPAVGGGLANSLRPPKKYRLP